MRKLFLVACLIYSFGAVAQYKEVVQTKRKLDSLYLLIKTHSRQDTTRVILLNEASHYQQNVDVRKNLDLASEALQLSKTLNFAKGIANSHRYLAHYFRMAGDYYMATVHAQEMVQICEESGYIQGIGTAYNLLGQIAEDNQEWEKGKAYYLKAAQIHENELKNKAGRIRDDTKLNRDLASDYLGLSILSSRQYKHEEGLGYIKKAESVYTFTGTSLGMVQNNYAIAYIGLGKYVEAKRCLDQALKIAELAGYTFLESCASLQMSELYKRTRQYDKSKTYLNRAISLSREQNNKVFLADAYRLYAELEVNLGHFDKAVGYYKIKDAYRDSSSKDEQAMRLDFIESRFESDKKDRLIANLHNEQELERLQHKYVFIGLGALGFILMVIFFLQQSHNRKTSYLLHVQQGLNEKLREMDQMKSRFFANISHEFRTPLSLILAPVEEKLNCGPQKDRDSFQLIRRNALRLLSLVNQVLDLSRLEAHKMDLSIRQGNLKELVTLICSSFDSLAESKGIHFKKEIAMNDTLQWFDSDKLEKILNNLLFNAFKFTSSGGEVNLRARLDEQGNQLRIQVTDTGIGISKEEQKHLFSPFFQSTKTSGEGEGSGLGLALVKELVALHGGTIQLKSELNEGTEFQVDLPVNKEAFRESEIMNDHIKSVFTSTIPAISPLSITHEEAVESDHAFDDSVLIVEDNVDLRKYISGILAEQFTVFTACDGDEGFAMSLKHMPSLVLSDVMMPGADGVAMTKRIKEDERTSHLPVVLLTARANESSKLEGLGIGADDYLSKPFSILELKTRITNLISLRKKLAARYRAEISAGVPLISAVSSHAPKERSHDEKFMMRVNKIIEENLSNPQFGVEAMAEEIGLSRAQLFRKVKAICGLSPNELINEVRLNRAAELIQAKADNFSQISYAVGYNEPSYFARRFRQKFGMSPKEYQLEFEKGKQV
jgi:signal transduction histidine kinase/DNA-binding response OmpR family regulator